VLGRPVAERFLRLGGTADFNYFRFRSRAARIVCRPYRNGRGRIKSDRKCNDVMWTKLRSCCKSFAVSLQSMTSLKDNLYYRDYINIVYGRSIRTVYVYRDMGFVRFSFQFKVYTFTPGTFVRIMTFSTALPLPVHAEPQHWCYLITLCTLGKFLYVYNVYNVTGRTEKLFWNNNNTGVPERSDARHVDLISVNTTVVCRCSWLGRFLYFHNTFHISNFDRGFRVFHCSAIII